MYFTALHGISRKITQKVTQKIKQQSSTTTAFKPFFI